MSFHVTTGRLATRLDQVMPKEQSKIPMYQLTTKASGFSDFSPSQNILFDKMKRTVQSVFSQHGFGHLEVPPFIHRRFAIGKVSEEHEAPITKQVFGINRLGTNDMTNYALAYDRTVPLALYAKGHMKELTFPWSRQDCSLSFRAEDPSLGRLNGFYQCDIDTIGPDLSLKNEVQTLTAMIKALEAIEVPSFKVFMNHINIPKELVKEAGFKKEREALNLIDNLDKTPPNEIVNQLHELEPNVPKEKIESLVNICQYRGPFEDFDLSLLADGKAKSKIEDIKYVIEGLKQSGIDPKKLCFAPGIVRGLEYYTGIVAETFMDKYPRAGSIASGGRYDGLVDDFMEKPTGINGVGFSIGLSRIFEYLSKKGEISSNIKTCAKVAVLYRNQELFFEASKIAAQFREEGVETLVYSGNSSKLKNQLDYANKLNVPYTVLVMDPNKYVVKDMENSGKQSEDLSGFESTIAKVREFMATTKIKGNETVPSKEEEKGEEKEPDLRSSQKLTTETK
ncbi:MAG: histidine--tRNA ligase [Chlamydiales bacterium]